MTIKLQVLSVHALASQFNMLQSNSVVIINKHKAPINMLPRSNATKTQQVQVTITKKTVNFFYGCARRRL